MSTSPPRKPLHERSNSQTNSLAAVRLVPYTPPRLLGERSDPSDDVYSRTPFPTHPSHILSPPGGLATKCQGSALNLNVSKIITTSKAQPSTGLSGSTVAVSTAHQPFHDGDSATGSPISRPNPLQKKRKHVAVHPDKTFSLVQQDESQWLDDGQKSPTSLSPKSSYDVLLSNAPNEGRSNSIVLCLPDNTPTGAATPITPAAISKQPISVDPISNSPWNYQLVGGLRKVPKTPDLKQKATSTSEPPLPPLPETSDRPTLTYDHNLSTKPSFQSTETATTTSENTNYKVYGNSSPSPSNPALAPPSSSDSNYQSLSNNPALAPPSSSDSNYQLLGDPSPTPSFIDRPQTSGSENYQQNQNYQLHGDPSPSTSYVTLSRTAAKYSQESLVVPPLKPKARRSHENFGYYKSRSRESLRTGSLTSISTVLSQQEAARAVVTSGSLINLPNLKSTGSSSWAESSGNHPPRSHMIEHPHQWSSQLSTVLSVSDGGTDRGSQSWSDSNGRRSSGFPSTHSRQMLSISSSLAQEESRSRSRSDSLEPPQPTFTRNGQRDPTGSTIRMVGDQDEHGDGITDMQELRTRPSRSRLSGFYSVTSSENGRTNTMQSTGSSRANSLLVSTIPTWARLYYGSGERRYLGAPGSSTEGTDSRPVSSFRSGSPNTDHFPLSIYSPRRRPREINRQSGRPSTRGSLEITPAPQLGSGELINDPYTRQFSRRFRSSSIWSPHLRVDRRATRLSVWDPPSISWSTEGGWYGRRNIQIVMFITGFIFPFAWMIAAFLPLPPNPMLEICERDHSTSNLDGSNDYAREFGMTDESRYQSAKWWRRLNWCMSVVGLMIIAVVIILVIIGIRQGW